LIILFSHFFLISHNQISRKFSQILTLIITLIPDYYVKTPKGLIRVFIEAGLVKFWFPVTRIPKIGDWPLVSDMVAKNQRLLVFTSRKSKEQSEGIAYQWNYMVENECKISPTIKSFLFFTLAF